MKNKTFEKAYLEYLEYAKLKQKPTSILSMNRKMKNQILPFFGKIKIKNINTKIYIKWQEEMIKKGYSYTFKKNCHYCICAIYEYLIDFHGIEKNIPKIVGNFKEIEYKENKINYWQYNEFKKFINVIENKIYNTLFYFLYFTGCRKGEALALTFNDIDFKNNIISINKTISKEKINGKRIIMPPKTKKSIRKIQIDKSLNKKIKILQEYYKTKYENFNNNFYIFGGNKPISTTTLERYKNYYCDKAKVKRIRIHDFRHSHATLLYNLNVPVDVISHRLGHSNLNTTLNVYIHNIDEKEKRAVEMLSSLN